MMKNILYITLPILLLAACNEDYIVKEPTLEVSAPAVVKVGQAVEFDLSGQQDILAFWSGEVGNEYAYKDRDRIGPGDTKMTFKTTTASGTAGNPNPSSLPLSYSLDFNGEYTEESMNAAHWTDITSEFEWPTDVGQTSIPAGVLDMNDILPSDGSPVYFRFAYHVAAYGTDNGRTQWTINSLHFYCDTPVGEVVAYDMFDQNWHIVPGDGYDTIPESNRPALPTTTERILFRSQFKPATDIYVWAISGAIVRPGNLNLGHDKSVGIKSLADPQMRHYYYTWNTPGEYNVTFVGINASPEGRKEVVREVKIKVIQDEGTIIGPVPSEWK